MPLSFVIAGSTRNLGLIQWGIPPLDLFWIAAQGREWVLAFHDKSNDKITLNATRTAFL
jgi:hypothetical protein